MGKRGTFFGTPDKIHHTTFIPAEKREQRKMKLLMSLVAFASVVYFASGLECWGPDPMAGKACTFIGKVKLAKKGIF